MAHPVVYGGISGTDTNGWRTGSVRWQDMSRRQRGALIVLVPIEVALTAAAAADLWLRRREDVRGRKALWWPALFVQPVGPLAYFAFGRRAGSPRLPVS